MASKRKPAVQRYHDRVAGRYDDSYRDAYWQWHDALTWDHIKPHLPRDANAAVLDLGCGTGKWALKLARSRYDVTGVDISHAMLEQARHQAEEAGLGGRCRFKHADLVDLGALPESHFALALAMGDPIGCTTDPRRALKEIRRCLMASGLLIATFDNRWAAIDFYLEKGDLEGLADFLKTGRTHWLTRDRAEQFPIHTYSPTQLCKLFEWSGYEVVDVIGKTVLPMRHYREHLEAKEARQTLTRIEKSLWRDPAAIGRAAHLQVVARVKK